MKVKPKWLVTYDCRDLGDRSWPVYIVKGTDERDAVDNAIGHSEGRWTRTHGNRFRVVRLDQTKEFRMATTLMEVFPK